MAAVRLAAEGRLDLDERLINYMPDFSMTGERYRDITIRHILSHTSGIPDIEDYHWQGPKTDRNALLRYAHSDEVRALHLLWEPGCGSFLYSNIAFDVLGAAFENITGKSFEMFMADFFFVPLGMSDSTFFTPLREYAGLQLARPHYKDEKKHIHIQPYYPYNREHAPSSTLTSTLSDMKKWGDYTIAEIREAMVACKPSLFSLLLRETVREHARVPGGNEKIGLAWFLREQNGYAVYGHEGSDDGFRSSFWICPELELQITVLANLNRAPIKRISKRIFDILIITLPVLR
jgi:CubicO group peptidase (beta-lactamase class C family)